MTADIEVMSSQKPLNELPEQQQGASDDFCSMYQCKFCHEECFASKVSQRLALSLTVEEQEGTHLPLLYFLHI